MKKLRLAVALVPVLAVAAAAAPVSSVCTFMTPSGQAQARFDIDNLLVRSTLSVNGVSIPNLQPACILHPRGGLRCPHGDGARRYEIYPYIDDATNKVVGMRALVYQGDADNPTPIEQADCSSL